MEYCSECCGNSAPLVQALVSADLPRNIPYPFDDAAVGYWIALTTSHKVVQTLHDPEAFHDMVGGGGYNEAETSDRSICVHHAGPLDMARLRMRAGWKNDWE